MPNISVSLPDGSVRELESGASVLTLAESIGSRLAKAALQRRDQYHQALVLLSASSF